MCGVAALIGPSLASEELERLVARVTRAVEHRGPDASGTCVNGSVALGHTRLRVVDPRPLADQPMTFGDPPSARLTFSGAILNHHALRKELRREHGVVFRTSSDTEVLLHVLRLFGERGVARLQGMFAFVFHDVTRGRVIAARDRVGIKPLLFARFGGGLVLASEAKAILASGRVARDVDRTALRQLARFNHPLGDHTFFDKVRSLEPGRLLTIQVDSLDMRVEPWSTLRIAPRPIGLDDAADALDSRFRASVARASDVDVPLGCYLSGGVDSTGIAAELVRTVGPRGGRLPRFYSLVLPGIAYSEEGPIDRAAAFLGRPTQKVGLHDLRLADFVRYAARAEMPQWWTSDLALGALAERARADGTAVVLAGEGPDELFAGYDVYRLARLRPLLSRFGGLARRSLAFGALATPIVRRLVPWFTADTSVAEAWIAGHDAERAEWIVDHFGYWPENLPLLEVLDARRPLLDRGGEGERYTEWERSYFRERVAPMSEGLGSIERNLHFEITERLPKWILHMGDRMSSAHGLELRFPYLDDELVTSALTLPLGVRASALEDKRVLRRMHARRLPRAIARRKKQPLYTPTAEWLGPVLADPELPRYWSREAFEHGGLLDFAVCDAARARLAGAVRTDALTRMVDEWLFTFALTTSILVDPS